MKTVKKTIFSELILYKDIQRFILGIIPPHANIHGQLEYPSIQVESKYAKNILAGIEERRYYSVLSTNIIPNDFDMGNLGLVILSQNYYCSENMYFYIHRAYRCV